MLPNHLVIVYQDGWFYIEAKNKIGYPIGYSATTIKELLQVNGY